MIGQIVLTLFLMLFCGWMGVLVGYDWGSDWKKLQEKCKECGKSENDFV